jgi:hypothetical protein
MRLLPDAHNRNCDDVSGTRLPALSSKLTVAALVLGLLGATLASAATLTPGNAATGQRLQTAVSVLLDEPAPAGGLALTLKSEDPARLLLSASPDSTGAGSITLAVRAGLRFSPDFYVQGLDRSGKATYTATAPGFAPGVGTVTLAPSGIVFARAGTGMERLLATTRQPESEVRICAALLDSEGNVEALQPLAGPPLIVKVANSNPRIGALNASEAAIPTGSACAATLFRPLSPGSLALSLAAPRGFVAAPRFSTLTATVVTPGIAVTNGISIGRNLQVEGAVNLGEAAPEGGVSVTLKSGDPKRLLLSTSATSPGVESITLAIPAGGFTAAYYLQALADSGSAPYSAAAPGYKAREGAVELTPSGLVIGGPQGPPDEAVLLRQDAADGPHGFVTNLSSGETTPVRVYTVHLDPITRRGADLTVQPLRAGLSVEVTLENANPAAGQIASRLRIDGGASNALAHFKPLAVGTTSIAVAVPEGFTKPANSTALTVMVRP